MARIFIEGFEGNSLDGWTIPGGSAAIASAVGLDMSGSYCLNLNGTNRSLRKNLGSSHASLYIALKWRPTNSSATSPITFYGSNAAYTAWIQRNAVSGKIEIYAQGGTLKATSATVISEMDRTYLVEIYYVPLNAGGTITVKIDGTQVVTYSGDTTNGLENIQYLELGAAAGAIYCYFDDIVIDDADWIGNTKIQGQFVTGAGATTGLTASAGNNWDCVEEIPYSDLNYVYGNTANLVDTYVTSDLVESVTAIKCIQVSARCAYAGSPTPTKQGIVIRPASTDRPHATDITPGIAFSRYDRIWELNPEDSAAFEAADLNGMEIGIKLVA